MACFSPPGSSRRTSDRHLRRARRPGRSRSRRSPGPPARWSPRPRLRPTARSRRGTPARATVRKRAVRVAAAVGQCVQLGQQLGHVVGVGDVFPGVAGRVDAGAPRRARRPPTRCRPPRRRSPVAATSARALSRALSSSVSPSSTTSGTSGGRGTSSTSSASPSTAAISATLSGLAEASTSRHDCRRRPPLTAALTARRWLGQHGRLPRPTAP